MLRYKIHILILFITLGMLPALYSQTVQDTSTAFFVQGGFFKSYTGDISGYKTINLGFIKRNSQRADVGVDFLINLGNKNINKEVYTDIFTQDSTIIIEGTSSFKEYELRFFKNYKILEYQNLYLRVLTSFGVNYREEVDDFIGFNLSEDRTFGGSLRIMPCLEYKISSKVSFITDFDLVKTLIGYKNESRLDYGYLDVVMRFPFTNMHLGIAVDLD